MSAVDRVEKLIALTASSNENEARNAAMLACKMIREHKLVFQREDYFKGPTVGANYSNTIRDEAASKVVEDFWNEAMRNATAHASRRAEELRRDAAKPGDNSSRWRLDYNISGRCWACKKPIVVGEPTYVDMSGRRAMRHAECGAKEK